ncbi:MAG: hypothetical protein IKI00_01585 [Bacteroidales bacterium]|nr:hypothetical protein [Bacteroidales bacterium]
MKNKKLNRYRPGNLGHIYHRSHNGYVIFYNVKDSLVFFTLIMLAAEKYNVDISGLCLMYNHYHLDFEAEGVSVRRFVTAYSSRFSREYNARYGLTGQLFEGYGLSNKKDNKSRRTAYAYLYNNPVEWRLCRRAEEYRWNFLKYAVDEHPFSSRIESRNMTRRLKRSMELVGYLRPKGRPLLYSTLDTLMDSLKEKEKRYLADFIIRKYSLIDYQRVISLYGTYERMTDAFSNNTGSEYDIEEEYDPTSGKEYKLMANYLALDKRYKGIGDVVSRPAEERLAYLCELVARCNVTVKHAQRFLHIQESKETD